MALREHSRKVNEENAHVISKKDVPTKRGALGEIGNRVNRSIVAPIGKSMVSKPLVSKPVTHKPVVLKNIQAKVVTRHTTTGPLTAIVKKKVPTVVTAVQPAVAAGPIAGVKPKLPKVKKEVVPQVKESELKPAYSAQLLPLAPLDDDDDPTHVAIYASEIYQYLSYLENKYKIRPNYLDGQVISKRMRAILIDWLVEVHQQFHLLQETLFLTVDIIDRFLQDFTTIDRKSLQLVGVAALSVACKYEEMFAPEIGDFVYIADSAFTKKQIMLMEGNILKTLDFNFGRPLPIHFLRRYSKAFSADAVSHTLAKYLLELSIIEYGMCHHNPSLVAAASILLSLWLLNGRKVLAMAPLFKQCSNYSISEIYPVFHQLAALALNSSKQSYQATRKKYAAAKYLSVSCRPEMDGDELKDLVSGENF